MDLVESLLRRIDSLEAQIHAWESVDREGALAAARLCAKQVDRGEAGPLCGVPLGVKDIFYTAGLKTSFGSPLFEEFVPDRDATCIARLRNTGATILGKTVTVQFAHLDPVRTRNPWDLTRTPGGSSSGSAAAVAARMVPAALGSQTGGSLLRPAAFCGTVGLKPTYGRVSRSGVLPAAWSFDHVGFLTRTVEDAALLLQATAGYDALDPSSSPRPVPDYVRAVTRRNGAPRFGVITETFDMAAADVAANVKATIARFERAGARLQEVRFPRPLPELLAIRNVIHQVEQAELHADMLRDHPEGYASEIRQAVEVGQLIPGVAYIRAQRLRRRLRPLMEQMLEGSDCLLLPTVADLPSQALASGKSTFLPPWSLVGFPTIAIPSGISSHRLPHSIQLVALPFGEEVLLSAAAWCEEVLGPMPTALPMQPSVGGPVDPGKR